MGASYQYKVSVPEAFKVTVPVPHLEELVVEGAIGKELIVARTGVLELLHPRPASA